MVQAAAAVQYASVPAPRRSDRRRLTGCRARRTPIWTARRCRRPGCGGRWSPRTGPWARLELRAETGSTNADVAEAARAGEPEGLVVVAERQTAGRGRRGRVWQSPPRAGIATSVLLRPGEAVAGRGWSPVPPAGYGWLPLLAGVALVEAVARLAELDAGLKWPNDLLVGGAKCAGVLAEAVPGASPAQPPAIVLGIGLNVTLRADELPENPTGLPATSLQLAGAAATDRDPLLRALLRSVADWYDRWRAAGRRRGGQRAARGVPGRLRHGRPPGAGAAARRRRADRHRHRRGRRRAAAGRRTADG